MVTLGEILKQRSSWSKEEEKLIEKAYNYAQKAHEDEERFSGEPYFNHLTETAKNLVDLDADAMTVAAGLLHDVIEDAKMKPNEVRKLFGDEILFLIDGVTKLGKLRYRGMERHAESLRKPLIATAKDIRVIMIKLADRLHNMQTLEHVPARKRKRIAQETLQIYAPIANRLGMGQVKGKLEDLAFPYIHPKKYKEVKELRQKKSKENIEDLTKVSKRLKKELAKEKIRILKSDYRIKHLYSLFKKLEKYDMNIERVYDIAALRIIVENVSDCYKTLGIIHGLWKPLPGRIKDYIASPKINGYQSLHTTVFTGDGSIVEIQIRTSEMHEEAEYGVAAHSTYKEHGSIPKVDETLSWVSKLIPFYNSEDDLDKNDTETPDWLKEISVLQQDVEKPEEFIKNLKEDFFEDRVFVFTPKGDVIDLPKGATPIDFAYSIHSEIGNHLSGAKIDGKLSSIDKPLENGDIVEIITSKKVMATRKWLESSKTTLARRKIKSVLQSNEK